MANVLIVAYLLIVLAMIAVILLQRSEGGGLGMGGGNSNGLMSVRGSANLLTRTTGILAALFFATAIGLTILSELDRGGASILDRATDGTAAPTTVLDAIQQLQNQTAGDLPVPAATDGTTPAAPVETAPAADPGLAVPDTTTPAAGDTPAATETPAAPAN